MISLKKILLYCYAWSKSFHLKSNKTTTYNPFNPSPFRLRHSALVAFNSVPTVHWATLTAHWATVTVHWAMLTVHWATTTAHWATRADQASARCGRRNDVGPNIPRVLPLAGFCWPCRPAWGGMDCRGESRCSIACDILSVVRGVADFLHEGRRDNGLYTIDN